MTIDNCIGRSKRIRYDKRKKGTNTQSVFSAMGREAKLYENRNKKTETEVQNTEVIVIGEFAVHNR